MNHGSFSATLMFNSNLIFCTTYFWMIYVERIFYEWMMNPSVHPCLNMHTASNILGFHSLHGKAYYTQISWNLKVVRSDINMIILFRNLTGASAAQLPRHLSNFRIIVWFYPISQLQDVMKSNGEISCRLVNRSCGYLTPLMCLTTLYKYEWKHPGLE